MIFKFKYELYDSNILTDLSDVCLYKTHMQFSESPLHNTLPSEIVIGISYL